MLVVLVAQVFVAHAAIHQWQPSPAPRTMDVDSGRVLTLHTLSEHPRLFRVDNLLDTDECDAIIAAARPRLAHSTTHHIRADGTRVLTAWRQSQSAWLPKKSIPSAMGSQAPHPAVAAFTRRAARLLKLPRSLVEGGNQLQVIHYDGTGHYHPHYDSRRLVDLKRADDGGGARDATTATGVKDAADASGYPVAARYATLLLFLNDVPAGYGGNTTFPLARMGAIPHELSQSLSSRNARAQPFWDAWASRDACDSSEIAKSFAPKKGSALLFYNHDVGPDGLVGDLDPWSLHGGCAVLPGAEKWAANLWVEVPPPHSQFRDETVTADLSRERVMAHFDWFAKTLLPGWSETTTAAAAGGTTTAQSSSSSSSRSGSDADDDYDDYEDDDDDDDDAFEML